MKIVKEFILREIVGEYLLIPTGTTSQEFNGMITLSDTAHFIWENLESSDSLEDLVNKITDEFEIDHETAYRDAFQFISELIQVGFVEPTKEDHSW